MSSLSDITKGLTHNTKRETARKLSRLISVNPAYRNLDQKNKKIILDIVDKYEKYLDKGYSITQMMIKKDRYKLYNNRIKFGLSQVDLKQIFKLLESFKK